MLEFKQSIFQNNLAGKSLLLSKTSIPQVFNQLSYVFGPIKNLFELYDYFPKLPNQKNKEQYLESLYEWILKEDEQNYRIVFWQVRDLLQNHFKHFDYKILQKKIASLPENWLKVAIQAQLLLSYTQPRVIAGRTIIKNVSNNLYSAMYKKILNQKNGSLPELMTLAILLSNKLSTNQKNDVHKHFRKAINKEFDYFPLYQAYYATIRNREHRLLFAIECYLTKRFDTFVPSIIWLHQRRFQGSVHYHWQPNYTL